MGVKGGPPASEAAMNLPTSSNPGDHTLSSSRNGKQSPLWTLEHVNKLLFVNETIVVSV